MYSRRRASRWRNRCRPSARGVAWLALSGLALVIMSAGVFAASAARPEWGPLVERALSRRSDAGTPPRYRAHRKPTVLPVPRRAETALARARALVSGWKTARRAASARVDSTHRPRARRGRSLASRHPASTDCAGSPAGHARRIRRESRGFSDEVSQVRVSRLRAGRALPELRLRILARVRRARRPICG